MASVLTIALFALLLAVANAAGNEQRKYKEFLTGDLRKSSEENARKEQLSKTSHGLRLIHELNADIAVGTVEEKEKNFNPTGAIKIDFDLSRGTGSYAGFHRQLHQVLATSRKVDGIPVLVAQTLPREPPTWILVTVSSGPNTKVTLAVRNDNIYVVGFGNKGGWFAFERFERQITGSTRLPVTEDYGKLIGGHKNLEGLDIGKEPVLQALAFLSTYKDKAHIATLGISLARIIVVVSEAARFHSFYETALQGLKEKAVLTGNEAKLVVLWSTISEQLITGKWEESKKLKEAGIKTKQDGIDAVKLLLLPSGVKVQRLAGNATN